MIKLEVFYLFKHRSTLFKYGVLGFWGCDSIDTWRTGPIADDIDHGQV
jgi:hypothetical protein